MVKILKIKIKNFKSIKNAEVKLAPLTILIGPPASGKSNILDCIGLLGYFHRFLQFNKEYGGNVTNIEPLTLIARFKQIEHLFYYQDLSYIIHIGVEDSDKNIMSLKIFYEKGALRIQAKDIDIIFDMKSSEEADISDILNRLSFLGSKIEDKVSIATRVYGYDRYGLSLHSCIDYLHCGFYLRLKGNLVRNTPRHLLSELGWNAPYIIKDSQDVVISLNYILTEKFSEKVEVKISRSGKVFVFDYDLEVDNSGVSDSIFRMLYYLLALRSAVNYVKLYGLEKRFVIMLEEPEAHVFPFFIDLLADYIIKATENMYVIITTHNPILVSALWDRVNDIKTYYVMRDKLGSTNVAEIDIDRIAKELITSEDLLFMPPSEVLQKYAVKQ